MVCAINKNCFINILKIIRKTTLISGFVILMCDEPMRYVRTRGLLMLLCVILVGIMAIPTVRAQTRSLVLGSIAIQDAYYGDLDSDQIEDDIKILVAFQLDDIQPSRIELYFDLVLPSGNGYSFKVIIYGCPTSALNLDCINMATESGIYTVSMVAFLYGSGTGKLYTTDYLEFDPPTGAGPGLPDIVAYF